MPPLVIDLPFGLSLDLSFWLQLTTWPVWEQISAIFAIIGWPFLIIIFYYLLVMYYKWAGNVKNMHDWTWVLLAIDIPQEVLQGPKAVEQIFANLHGSALFNNLAEEYWYCKYQKWFSFEIVSLEGYIQFLIRTEIQFRDLVEAAIYAQYPEAEITEVEDYVDNIPSKYPNDQYDIMGWEFILEASDVYPIRTYQEFEHSISKDVVFNDPMAAILETFSRVGPGEHFWYQIIIFPSIHEAEWKEKGIKEAKKIIQEQGEKPHHDTWLSKIGDIPRKIMEELFNILHWSWEEQEHAATHEARPASIMDLTPGLKDTLQSVEEKISKNAYKTKIRVLYAGRKEIFDHHKCMEGFVGSMKQFFNTSRNGFKPTKFTYASYAFANYRANYKKNLFIRSFKDRKPKMGATPIMLNIEELATIWHFPLAFVKTPLLQKSTHKRAEPPTNLPLDIPGLAMAEMPTRPELVTDAPDFSDELDLALGPSETEEIKTDQPNFDKDLPYG